MLTGFEGGGWDWAYFIDFENLLLETWGPGKLFNAVTFEELVKGGVEEYLARIGKLVEGNEELAVLD